MQRFPIVSYSFSSTGCQKKFKFRKKFRGTPNTHQSNDLTQDCTYWSRVKTSSHLQLSLGTDFWGVAPRLLPKSRTCSLSLESPGSELPHLVSGCASWWCDKGQLVFYASGLLSHQASMFMVNNLHWQLSWESTGWLPCACSSGAEIPFSSTKEPEPVFCYV